MTAYKPNQFEIDLVDMQSLSRYNAKKRYLLTAIDVFTKRAFAEPIDSKTGENVQEALKVIFERAGRVPEKIHFDEGNE